MSPKSLARLGLVAVLRSVSALVTQAVTPKRTRRLRGWAGWVEARTAVSEPMGVLGTQRQWGRRLHTCSRPVLSSLSSWCWSCSAQRGPAWPTVGDRLRKDGVGRLYGKRIGGGRSTSWLQGRLEDI